MKNSELQDMNPLQNFNLENTEVYERNNMSDSVSSSRRHSKNLSHAVRLLHTGIEIAKTGKYIVNRENIDRDLLLEIKRGEKSYDELISYIKSKKNEMEQAMKNSSLPDNIDINKINDLVLTIRKKQLNIL